MEPLDKLPKKAYDDFKESILEDGLKPSAALYKIMKEYKSNEVHVTSVVHLAEHTCRELDISRQGFRFYVIDSAYPQNPSQFSDDDFDKGIE